uniref:Uncharacterized protein n=1 Tax=Oryza punctata TaxID=4537 RepID=A0A0E0MJT6_ORYPU
MENTLGCGGVSTKAIADYIDDDDDFLPNGSSGGASVVAAPDNGGLTGCIGSGQSRSSSFSSTLPPLPFSSPPLPPPARYGDTGSSKQRRRAGARSERDGGSPARSRRRSGIGEWGGVGGAERELGRDSGEVRRARWGGYRKGKGSEI